MIEYLISAVMLLQIFSINIYPIKEGLITSFTKFETILEDEECLNRAEDMIRIGNEWGRTVFAYCIPLTSLPYLQK